MEKSATWGRAGVKKTTDDVILCNVSIIQQKSIVATDASEQRRFPTVFVIETFRHHNMNVFKPFFEWSAWHSEKRFAYTYLKIRFGEGTWHC